MEGAWPCALLRAVLVAPAAAQVPWGCRHDSPSMHALHSPGEGCSAPHSSSSGVLHWISRYMMGPSQLCAAAQGATGWPAPGGIQAPTTGAPLAHALMQAAMLRALIQREP